MTSVYEMFKYSRKLGVWGSSINVNRVSQSLRFLREIFRRYKKSAAQKKLPAKIGGYKNKIKGIK